MCLLEIYQQVSLLFANRLLLFISCVSLTVIVAEMVIGPVKELPQRFWIMELFNATALI